MVAANPPLSVLSPGEKSVPEPRTTDPVVAPITTEAAAIAGSATITGPTHDDALTAAPTYATTAAASTITNTADPFDNIGRAPCLLIRILRDQGQVPLRRQAEALGIPLSTAYRLAAQLHEAGLISRNGRGYFAAGLELARLTQGIQPARVTADAARPHLQRLARRVRLTVHLGIIEEDMVTYLSKVHGGGPTLFTRSGTQLEAYCSAIGKVLLAALPEQELDRYLGTGQFVALTPNTLCSPEALRQELGSIRSADFAIDAGEVLEDLRCVAVPVRDRHKHLVAAVSVARRLGAASAAEENVVLAALRDCAQRIEADL